MQRLLLPAENGRDGSRAENGRDPRISLENVELEALMPKATARVYMEAPGAKTEAPKQPKKQDETEAPPG